MTAGSDRGPGWTMGVVFGPAVVAVVISDLFTKWLAFRSLDSETVLSVIPGLLNLRLSLNRGAVFGIGQGLGPLFIVFTLAATLIIVWVAWGHGRSSRLLTVGLALVLGGALGNLWDRLVYKGVRDFIDLYVGQHHWPTFNVADMAICTGAGLVILYSFLSRGPQEGKSPA